MTKTPNQEWLTELQRKREAHRDRKGYNTPLAKQTEKEQRVKNRRKRAFEKDIDKLAKQYKKNPIAYENNINTLPDDHPAHSWTPSAEAKTSAKQPYKEPNKRNTKISKAIAKRHTDATEQDKYKEQIINKVKSAIIEIVKTARDYNYINIRMKQTDLIAKNIQINKWQDSTTYHNATYTTERTKKGMLLTFKIPASYFGKEASNLNLAFIIADAPKKNDKNVASHISALIDKNAQMIADATQQPAPAQSSITAQIERSNGGIPALFGVLQGQKQTNPTLKMIKIEAKSQVKRATYSLIAYLSTIPRTEHRPGEHILRSGWYEIKTQDLMKWLWPKEKRQEWRINHYQTLASAIYLCHMITEIVDSTALDFINEERKALEQGNPPATIHLWLDAKDLTDGYANARTEILRKIKGVWQWEALYLLAHSQQKQSIDDLAERMKWSRMKKSRMKKAFSDIATISRNTLNGKGQIQTDGQENYWLRDKTDRTAIESDEPEAPE